MFDLHPSISRNIIVFPIPGRLRAAIALFPICVASAMAELIAAICDGLQPNTGSDEVSTWTVTDRLLSCLVWGAALAKQGAINRYSARAQLV